MLGLDWEGLPVPLSSNTYCASMEAFTVEDYTFLFRAMGGDKFGATDFEKVFQTSSKLTTHKIRKLCHFITDEVLRNTASFIKFLVAYALDSNVDQGKVEEVSLEDLYGAVISGTDDFYNAFMRIVYKAKENAPSILFIDDCDVLFENGEETGKVKEMWLTASEELMNRGACFDRPYGVWADMVYRRAGNYTTKLMQIKQEMDPAGIMNPGRLCFK